MAVSPSEDGLAIQAQGGGASAPPEPPAIEEARRPMVMPSLGQPTECEIEEHNISHLPPRWWRPHCVRGMGKALPHRGRRPEDSEKKTIPTVAIDYYFLGSTNAEKRIEEERDLKILPQIAVRSHPHRVTVASATPSKGVTEHSVQMMMDTIKMLCYKKFIFKSDQERSIVALKEAVRCAMKEVEFLMGESPVGEHQANGLVESAIG